MFYHGSNIGGIKELRPNQSNEGNYVYFSDERFRIIPYLVNPIQKFVDEKYGKGKYNVGCRWARYKSRDNCLLLWEPYPNYTEDTFKGQVGYVYLFEDINDLQNLGKPHFFGLAKPVKVEKVDVIPDVYEEILKLQKEGKILIQRYEDNTDEENKQFLKGAIRDFQNTSFKFYKEFLIEKMPGVKEIAEKE